MKITQLIGNKLVLKTEAFKSKAGIILPEESRDKNELKEGIVLHVGTEVPYDVKVDDTVIYKHGFDSFPEYGEQDVFIGAGGGVIAIIEKK